MKTKTYLIAILLFLHTFYKACEACDLKQPKITRGLTHGAGPQSFWDWIAVGIIVVISFLTVFYFVKYIVKPESKKDQHIKNSILNF
ncbi:MULTISPECIES: hypothetical protein [Amniculibacterium]|jgi:hypothetical protein|uniref:hypothetical protein n=1 Tax=Amniculibacterium TaxID=2715289 RepID=UPI000F59D6DC|nr:MULTISPECIES: hypothetical protein [Amniculibacterium]